MCTLHMISKHIQISHKQSVLFYRSPRIPTGQVILKRHHYIKTPFDRYWRLPYQHLNDCNKIDVLYTQRIHPVYISMVCIIFPTSVFVFILGNNLELSSEFFISSISLGRILKNKKIYFLVKKLILSTKFI